jgi:very-short-patch-repair endonuclease
VRNGPAHSGGHLGRAAAAGRRSGRGFNCGYGSADLLEVDVAELPPLTGSVLLDPWRIRYRRLLAGDSPDEPADEASRRPTRSEKMLWSRLRLEPQPWSAEVPTEHGYVLDFFCPAAQLAVEVDGGYHRGRGMAGHDDRRDEFHLTRGIVTKRFTDREVETDLDWVVDEIQILIGRRLGLSAHPLQPALPVAEATPWSWAGQLHTACVDVLPVVPAQRGLLSRLSGRPPYGDSVMDRHRGGPSSLRLRRVRGTVGQRSAGTLRRGGRTGRGRRTCMGWR